MPDEYYLAIDPGLTSGWARFDGDTGEIIAFGQFKYEDRDMELRRLITPNCKGVITEDYKNYAWKRQKNWSRNETSKLIGGIEAICAYLNVKHYLQASTCKPIGYRWAGLDSAPSNHAISHQYDAVAHGVYWLQTNGIRRPGQSMRMGDI